MLADQPRQSKTGNRRIPLLVRLLGPLTTRAGRDQPLMSPDIFFQTLPAAVEVTSMFPSATPARTCVRIYTRWRIHRRCGINRVFLNHYSRLPYKDWAVNHHCL
jgi:hypothetical protein